MQDKRPIIWLPFVLALCGILLLVITILCYISLDGAHFVIPGYKVPPDPNVTQAHWRFFSLSGLFLLMLLVVILGSVRPVGMHRGFSIGVLKLFAIVLTLVLLFHFLFTVCA